MSTVRRLGPGECVLRKVKAALRERDRRWWGDRWLEEGRRRRKGRGRVRVDWAPMMAVAG